MTLQPNRDQPSSETETMETKDRDTLARLLRSAASQTIGPNAASRLIRCISSLLH
jgi:hypothetical protein